MKDPPENDRAVEGGEFVVAGWDDFAEVGAEDFLVFLESLGGGDEDHALFGELLLHVRVGGLGVVLGFHTGEERAFLLGDAEALKGLENFRRNFIPAALGLLPVGEVVADFVEIDVVEVGGRPVRRRWLAFENSERFVAEFANPVRVVFDIRDVVDGGGGEAPTRIELVVLRERKSPLVRSTSIASLVSASRTAESVSWNDILQSLLAGSFQ